VIPGEAGTRLLAAVVLLAALACTRPSPVPTAVPSTPTPEITPAATARPAIPAPTLRQTATRVPSAPEAVNRIAFVGGDNQIYTVDPDGSRLRRISPDPETPGLLAGYTWPAWSPDGRWLFMSAIIAKTQTQKSNNVAYVADESSPEMDALQIHADESGSQGILPGVIHYPLWSPDGKAVVVLAATSDRLLAYLAKTDGSPSAAFFGGAPMYVAWSGDSNRLYLHQGERLLRFGFEPNFTSEFIGSSALYQAPAVTDGSNERVAFLEDKGASGADLIVVWPAEERRSVLMHVTSRSAFEWSPDGRLLAVTVSENNAALSYNELLIADPESGDTRSLYQGPVISFMWSPDGRRMLVAGLHPEREDAYRWSVLDIASGESTMLGDWRPTQEFGEMLAFFGQFAKSHRLWSPDGRYVVLSGEPLTDDSKTTRGDLKEHLWVIDTTGKQEPRVVGAGYLGFWSPR